MKTRKRTLLWIVVLSFFAHTQTWAATPADLKVMSLSVSEVYGGNFWLTYTVKNIGGSPLELYRLRIQTFASPNNVLDANDLSAGIVNVGPFAPTLAPGQSYTNTINASVGDYDLEYRHFIFANFTVRPGYVSQETVFTNNVLSKDALPSFADLVVENLIIDNVNGRGFDYRYTIRNAGVGKALMAKHFHRLSLSDDLALGNDIQFGNQPITSGYVELGQGQTFVGSGTIADAGVSLNEYDHVFLQVILIPGQSEPDQNHDNEIVEKYIVGSFSDLKFSNVTITHVNGKTFTYNFTITNGGNSNLYINRYDIKLSVSSDNVPDAADPAVGYIAIPTTQIALIPGATYTKFGTAVSPVDLEQYPNFFLKASLLPDQINPEITLGNNIYKKPIPPVFTDLVVESITIDNVYSTTIDYTYTVRNIGVSTLYLDRHYFQTYVSNNNSLDGADVLTGGELFTSTPLALSPGESFTKSTTTSTTSNLLYYRFLILDARVLAGQFDPQANKDNDRLPKNVAGFLPNLMVNNIEFSYADANTLSYKYYVSNTGFSDLHLDQFYIETYFSADNTYDIFDIPAGDTIFDTDDSLITNAYYAHTLTSHANVNRTQYPYLVFLVKPKPGQIAYDLDQANSRYIIYAPPALNNNNSSLSKSGAYAVTRSEDALDVANTSHSPQQSTYALYNLSGEKIAEGQFLDKTQITVKGMLQGIYLVKISDGTTNETIKLFLGE